MPFLVVAVPFRDNWYFDAVCEGIVDRADAAHVDVQMIAALPGAAGREDVAAQSVVLLGQEQCVGVIAVGFEFKQSQVHRLRAHGKPVVVIGGPHPDFPSISAADSAVAKAATEHLLGLGHQAIAHLAGYALSADDFSMRTDRVRGYSEAMQAAGLEGDSHVIPCHFTYESAYNATTRILSESNRPTAVFAVADELALAVLDAARDLGILVPEDLSVIGIDDHPGADARRLTTWRQDPGAIGVAAAERALEVTDFQHLEFGFAFVDRATTAPPPGRTRPASRSRWNPLRKRRPSSSPSH